MYARSEVEDASAHWWEVGNVDEDWAAWVGLYVTDVRDVDHFWGPLRGRRDLDLWEVPAITRPGELAALLAEARGGARAGQGEPVA